jgi:hypothetical protein
MPHFQTCKEKRERDEVEQRTSERDKQQAVRLLARFYDEEGDADTGDGTRRRWSSSIALMTGTWTFGSDGG